MNGKKSTRVAFADFWQGFNPHDSILSAVLRERLNMVIVDRQDEADLLIYSVFGNAYRQFKGIRVFYTAESVKPLWDECDYAISFMREDVLYPECHLRLPNWMGRDYIKRTGVV